MKGNAVCTILHQYYDTASETTRFAPFYLGGVHWQERCGLDPKTGGVESTDSLRVYLVSPHYLPPEGWQKGSAGWTVAPGDRILRGAVTDYEHHLRAAYTVTGAVYHDYGTKTASHWAITGVR